MPATPYTVILYAVTNAFGPFPLQLPNPTTGTAWVIRDVCFYLPVSGAELAVSHQARLLVGGNQVAATPAYRSVANTLYETRDIRQRIDPGEVVALDAQQGGWNLQVTGYLFQ